MNEEDTIAECNECEELWIGEGAFQRALDHMHLTKHETLVRTTI